MGINKDKYDCNDCAECKNAYLRKHTAWALEN